MPKSYMTDDERKEWEGYDRGGLYAAESEAADAAGDTETAWEWLRLVELPAHSLLAAKLTHGADWVRKSGLRLETAEAAYGKDWLDKDVMGLERISRGEVRGHR